MARRRRMVMLTAQRYISWLLRRPDDRFDGPGHEHDQPQRPHSLVESAKDAGWKLSQSEKAFLRALHRRLRRRQGGRVAVFVDGGPRELSAVIHRTFPRIRIVTLETSMSASDVHVRLAASGRFDLIVDDAPLVPGRVDHLRNGFFHLVPGGAFIVRNFQAGEGVGATQRESEGIWAFVSGLIDVRSAANGTKEAIAPYVTELAQAIRSVAVEAEHLMITNGVKALAKMREDEIDALLQMPSGANRGTVLERRPPREFRSRCQVTEHGDFRHPGLQETFSVPAVSLREYHDVVCRRGQVAVQGNLLLPDTYRHHQYARLANRSTKELSPLFAQIRRTEFQPRVLPGAYFHLDSEWPGHFGHVMTEQLSRLWAWPAAKQAEPDLRALLALPKGKDELSAFELAVFGAAGVDAADLVTVDRAVRVEKLLAATPMLSMPNYVHPDLKETWTKVGRTLAASASLLDNPRRIFCSRRPTYKRRRCHNVADVESLFAGEGFDVIHPEDLSMADQAKLFRGAEVVAGFSGSGLLNVGLCELPKRVIMISPTSYRATNEYLMAAVMGHTIDIVWCQSDVPRPENGWNRDASRSGFTFDFDREGMHLKAILASL